MSEENQKAGEKSVDGRIVALTVIVALFGFFGLFAYLGSSGSCENMPNIAKDDGTTDAVNLVRGHLPSKYSSLELTGEKTSTDVIIVSGGGMKWKVKGVQACAANGAAKTMTPRVPFCTQVGW